MTVNSVKALFELKENFKNFVVKHNKILSEHKNDIKEDARISRTFYEVREKLQESYNIIDNTFKSL